MSEPTNLDLTGIRARLQAARGEEYWRSLEELADTEAFQEALHREFPQGASEWIDPVTRRGFLKLMGASLALAGVTACTKQPPEKIIPYVKQPEELIPGKPLYFASAIPVAGVAAGVLIESHEGRPTKIEGNPDHPASLGAADVFTQAAILGLYDPDRSQTLTHLGEIRTWSALLDEVRAAIEAKRGRQGAGLRILTETITSPTLADQIQQLLAEFPAARWHQWEPAGRDQVREGARLAFGEHVDTQYSFDKADVVLSLDSDFLACGPGSVRYARDFASRRRLGPGSAEMNRLYVVESTLSNTGAVADHRLAVKPSRIEAVARAIAAALGVPGASAGPGAGLDPDAQKWAAAVARDLQRHPGATIVMAGDEQPASVHALAHAVNQALGNVGKTLAYTEPIEPSPVNQLDSLRHLVDDMNANRVDMLVILGGNPVYTAPADFKFADALSKVALRLHVGLYHDETAALCHWHLPEAHPLESWSDTRAYDGTVSIIQPLIAPLYSGKTAHEVVAAFSKQAGESSYDLVRAYWKRRFDQQQPGVDFEPFWRKALHDGLVPDTAAKPKAVTAGAVPAGTPAAGRAASAPARGLEVVFRADPTVFDGRFANNGWLQELPKPHTKLTWDNAVLIAPATAGRLGLGNEDVVELRYRGRSVKGPVWVLPGHAPDTVTVHLGYGRTRAGRAGTGPGFDAYAIRTSRALWSDRGLELQKTGDKYRLVSTQGEQVMEGRHLVRAATLDQYRKNPKFAHELVEAPKQDETLYREYKYEGYKWGMTIDLNACVGCNACVVACQSENNIPVVGKTEVGRGHKMHWLRIDRYYRGSMDNPEAFNQPVPCQQCENAPCEVVCPVGATNHSSEGLNDMVYNRCVGTRYCSNNCPYKVRRFNFLLYQDWNTPSLKLMRNPDVTVRSRGVMEKCTYCVQRINAAKIEAEKENRAVGDGEILTACQATCPAEAIVFGNVNDPTSRVATLKAQERNYGLLEDLNTRPRTTYLAAVRNPNPELAPSGAGVAEEER
jgi:molybdopterin-containing oxidoreductase family iron-sulfur binding subunit